MSTGMGWLISPLGTLVYMSAEGKRKDIATQIAAAVRAKQLSAQEVNEIYSAKASAHNPALNAMVAVAFESSQEGATAIDNTIASGLDPGSLAGVPCAVKDNLCTQSIRTTCASRILEDWVAPYNATVVDRLIEQGSVVMGKTNLDEFGMGSSTEYSIFGPTRNPYDTDRVAGGSSGGSAAAVAAGLVPIALGSDTGGSVRQPAALCGIVGVKPTYGRVSRYGLTAYASSFDQVGCLTATVKDAALVFDVLAGHDPQDSTSLQGAMEKVGPTLERGATRLRIGVIKELMGDGVAGSVLAAVESAALALSHSGALIDEVSLPSLDSGLAAYYQIASAEASSNLARYDGVRFGLRVSGESAGEMIERSRTAGFGDEVKRRIMLGTYVLSAGYYDAYYERARKVRTLVCQDFAATYAQYDVLLAPTYPTTAFKLGEKISDPAVMYAGDVCTVPSNLAGHPSMSVPFGADSSGLPIGVQILAPALREDLMFRTGLALEDAAPSLRGPNPAIFGTDPVLDAL
jgi:aspartyl-tRNA(Asn)/glutamyl-tRNA(Gln) amidotransferase subunit A